MKQWPHARPPDPEGYSLAIAAVFTEYPIGLVRECTDPRIGLAKTREFPPTIHALVNWLDARLAWHQGFANHKPRAQKPTVPAVQYSEDHKRSMIEKLQKLMHDTFGSKPEWTRRTVGPFEQPNDKWNSRRPSTEAAE